METCDACGDGLLVLVKMGESPLFECDKCGAEYTLDGTKLKAIDDVAVTL